MLNVEVVTIVAGGAPYDEWERMTVTAALNDATRTFTIETTERPGSFRFPPGTPVQIRANGDLLVDGYVNAYEASGDAKSHKISIKGRSKGQDFVDSSAEHKKGNWKNKTPEDVAKELNKWPIQVKAEVKLDPVDYIHLKQGESPFQLVERYLRPEGVSMMGEPNGDILLTNAEAAKATGVLLMEGVNIKDWKVSLTDGSRHSSYTVKGQRRRGTGKGNLRVRRTSRDSGVRRHRPKIMANETDTDDKRAGKRARHEKERRAGKSVQATIKTQGFRDDRGRLFGPNRLVFVWSPVLMHLAQTMLIERVEFTQDNGGGKGGRGGGGGGSGGSGGGHGGGGNGSGGSIVSLTLVDPRAYKGKGGGKGGSGGAGSAPGAPATGEESHPAWTDGYDGDADI